MVWLDLRNASGLVNSDFLGYSPMDRISGYEPDDESPILSSHAIADSSERLSESSYGGQTVIGH